MKRSINKCVDLLENHQSASSSSVSANVVDESINNNSSPFYLPINAEEVISAEELTPPSIFDLSDEDSVESFTGELSE